VQLELKWPEEHYDGRRKKERKKEREGLYNS
jgi:hypothetical protein